MFIELGDNIINVMHITSIVQAIDGAWGGTEHLLQINTVNFKRVDGGPTAEFCVPFSNYSDMLELYNKLKDILGVVGDIRNVRYDSIQVGEYTD